MRLASISRFGTICVIGAAALLLASAVFAAEDITLTVLKASDDAFTSPSPVPMKWETRNNHKILVSPRMSPDDKVRFRLTSKEGDFFVYLPYFGTSERFKKPDAETELLFPKPGSAEAPVGTVWEGPRWKSVDAPGQNVVFIVLSPTKLTKGGDSGVLEVLGIGQTKSFLPSKEAKSVDAMGLAAAAAGAMAKSGRDLQEVGPGGGGEQPQDQIQIVAGKLEKTLIIPIVLDFRQ